MKRVVCLLSASALVVAAIGCQTATEPATPAAQSNTADPAGSEFTLVTLNVPNMV